MPYYLKDIDPDGVLMNYKIQQKPDSDWSKGFDKGYNQSCSDHQKLGVEVCVEEIIKSLLKVRYGNTKNFGPDAYNDAKEYAHSIVQNPKIFKIVRVK